MKVINGKVISCETLTKDFTRIVLEAPEIAGAARPGQFVHVNCGQGVYSLMRRPISVHDVYADKLVLLFQIKGEGTKWLTGRRPGDLVDLMGPLGHGFSLPQKGPALLVAGGIGVAPLCFLAKEIQKKQVPLTVLFGARDQESLCLLADIEKTGAKIKVATEDGSAGRRGLVTQLLEEAFHEAKPEIIYCCGPELMLKAVVTFSGNMGIETQVSLEERMACGIGACRGCVAIIKRNGISGYENVCSSGPVFRGSEVVFHG